MGVVREIHSAYGVSLKGEIQEYTWYYGGTDDVIMRIWVNEREVYLGHQHFIILSDPSGQRINMEADKDLLCYWLSKNPKTDEELETFFLKEYHRCLWKHFAQQWMFKERQDEELERIAARAKEKRDAQLDELHKYAEKKKFYMVVQYDQIYFIKYDKRKYKAEDLDKVGADNVLKFARDYPGNGVDIVEERRLAI